TRAALAPYARARTEAFRHKALVVHLVQAFVSYPALLEYVAGHGLERAGVRSRLSAVLGDYVDARTVLHPRFLMELVRG
ncbi:MAG: hypothetical protein M3P51_06085, partial [Chloroflexota bacterium]|nr:hypothetical protein [Chloroflexota bacterium]